MSAPAAHVHIDLGGVVRPVGRLWVAGQPGSERASFEFVESWLRDPLHYALGPALPPTAGPFHTADGRTMFGALADSAPDRWGRKLIARYDAQRAKAEGRTPRTPREIDYLLGVSDIVRQGALRFTAGEAGPYLADRDEDHVPPLVDLGHLLSAADALQDDPESVAAQAAVRLLLAPGSSLGGARPKASVRDRDGALAIAKFPEQGDEFDAVRWEALMLALAREAGIEVPGFRLEPVADRLVLLIRRFDRVGSERVPFLSAMSLLDAGDGDRRSYVELADAVRQISSQAVNDGPRLWRRLAFNILASNFDDHLRNHALLYDGIGWTLSPAYDLNPVPIHLKPRLLATAINIDDDPTASIELAVEAAEEFRLKPAAARKIAGEVARGVRGWRARAARLGIAAEQIERMESAFEHDDARAARAW